MAVSDVDGLTVFVVFCVLWGVGIPLVALVAALILTFSKMK